MSRRRHGCGPVNQSAADLNYRAVIFGKYRHFDEAIKCAATRDARAREEPWTDNYYPPGRTVLCIRPLRQRRGGVVS